jgi:hypothetical protein
MLVADQHESATTQVPGEGVSDSQGEVYGHRRIDCIASLLQDRDPGVAGVVLHAGDHGVFRTRRFSDGLLDLGCGGLDL